jgi:hypothetical protein
VIFSRLAHIMKAIPAAGQNAAGIAFSFTTLPDPFIYNAVKGLMQLLV